MNNFAVRISSKQDTEMLLKYLGIPLKIHNSEYFRTKLENCQKKQWLIYDSGFVSFEDYLLDNVKTFHLCRDFIEEYLADAVRPYGHEISRIISNKDALKQLVDGSTKIEYNDGSGWKELSYNKLDISIYFTENNVKFRIKW
jgi:hypothetical protein